MTIRERLSLPEILPHRTKGSIKDNQQESDENERDSSEKHKLNMARLSADVGSFLRGGILRKQQATREIEVIEKSIYASDMVSKDFMDELRRDKSIVILHIEDLVAEEKIDLIHARSRAPAWSAYVAAKRTETPFVTTYHGAYSGRTGLKKRYNSVMARGDLVIANSEWTAAHVMETHETPREKIVTIPRGVDFEAFDPEQVSPERIDKIRADWNIDQNDQRLRLVLPGRLTSWKGQALAIDALGALEIGERAGLHLILPGDAQGRQKYVTELEDKIIAHQLGGTVSIVGHTEDMPAAYAFSDIILAPSTRPEAFGRVAAEASAMGKPVIVADHGGQRETVIEGETGTRAEPGSVTALTACIRTLIHLRPEARAAMGAAGQAHIRENYSKKQLQTATLNVYARLLLNKA